jgi:hypothetical protein
VKEENEAFPFLRLSFGFRELIALLVTSAIAAISFADAVNGALLITSSSIASPPLYYL